MNPYKITDTITKAKNFLELILIRTTKTFRALISKVTEFE